MIRLESDYTEGALPEIMDALIKTNAEQSAGYGMDEYCAAAAELIRQWCGQPQAEVHFMMGGTQANLTVIAFFLRPHQGVLAADSGHISIHETGAIEAVGHKVLTLLAADGKISAAQVEKACLAHQNDEAFEHTVQPQMVYISQPTECGTLYSLKELKALREICLRYGLYLYIDGARLGYALASPENDVDIKALAALCDAFYIGGTKQGALFGEAVVLTAAERKGEFRYLMKQKGGLLAKGRLLGVQFEALLRDQLYVKKAEHAVRLALQIRQAFAEKGIEFLYPSFTNQQFPILPKQWVERLKQKYAFYIWQEMDEERTAIRLCTSWATKGEAIHELLADIRRG